jgi:hypothetical protein
MNKILLSAFLATSLVGTFVSAEAQTAQPAPGPVTTPPMATLAPVFNGQETYWISTNGVRVRATPELNSRSLGILSLNDQVKIVDGTIYNDKFIEIQIVKTYDPIVKSEKYYVAIDYLSSKKVDYKNFEGKYFVVINIASETIRAYERVCADNSCPAKMIMESEVVVGEDTDHPKEEPGKGRSILGSYRVTGWTKFYQDPEGHYPAWYRDGYPATPASNAAWNEWFSKKVMPLDEKGKAVGKMRGAFGWFAAFVAPEPYGQWIHGTLGWGSDKDKFIKRVKKPLINMISDPRSSGCTRNNNEAVAFLKNLIDVGTPVIKIYAKEALLDPTLASYNTPAVQWNYVMTKSKSLAVDRNQVLNLLKINGADLDAFWQAKLAGGELILDPKDPLNQVIEVGTYVVDSHPDIIEYTPGEKLSKISRRVGRKGNVYGVKDVNMHGTFFVDAGVLQDYAHPGEILEVSGFKDEVTPSWMKFENLNK